MGRKRKSEKADVFGLQPFGALFEIELDFGALVKLAVAVHLDGGEMHEHILAGRALDEAVALGGVEPLNDTFFSHHYYSLKRQPLRRGIRREGLHVSAPNSLNKLAYQATD